MKLLLSFVFISVANAASQNGSFIRGGSSAADEADTTHVVPGDIFAGLRDKRGCDISSQCYSDEYCYKQSCGLTGQCLIKPRQCNANDDPVCGCDDKTYSNACDASARGRTSVKFTGKCSGDDNRGICDKSSDCFSDEYCMKQSCGQTGQCVAKPKQCNADNNPVCGCDNKTYSNACEASTQGRTSVKSTGKCSGDDNRGICDKSSDCYSDEYCMKQSCGQTGQCVAMPKQCNANNDPVCGCDNKTYSNACEASAQGRTTVKSTGKCSGDSNRGTCNSNNSCQSNEYCDFPDGACGRNGVCKPIPSGQDCNGVTNDKVCGCDNVQYKNSCKANQSRTSIQNMGNCFNEDFAFE